MVRLRRKMFDKLVIKLIGKSQSTHRPAIGTVRASLEIVASDAPPRGVIRLETPYFAE